MTNRKSTKRALLGSVMAMVLCLAMLVGATFAWFTDTASTGVNKIQAGNLDIELQMKDNDGNWVNAEGKTLPFLVNGKIPAEGTEILWEPGCTYMLPELRVFNKGNLAVKFEYVPELLGVTGKLAEVLEPVFKVPTDVDIEMDVLKPGEYSPAWSFGYRMSETAGNDYQNETAAGAYVTVIATQASYESDSIDNTYDKDAEYPVADVATFADLKAALTEGGIVNLNGDVDVESPMNVTGTAILNATGKTVSNTKDIWNDGEEVNDWSLISAQGNANLIINGGNYQAKKDDCYAVDLQDKGVVVTIRDGEFIGNISAVYVFEGELRVEGGFFAIQQKNSNGVGGPYDYVLNCYDANREAGTAKIIVTGGTFVNFNPADNYAEGAHTNFVADGYKVVSEAHGTDTWYTVVKG